MRIGCGLLMISGIVMAIIYSLLNYHKLLSHLNGLDSFDTINSLLKVVEETMDADKSQRNIRYEEKAPLAERLDNAMLQENKDYKLSNDANIAMKIKERYQRFDLSKYRFFICESSEEHCHQKDKLKELGETFKGDVFYDEIFGVNVTRFRNGITKVDFNSNDVLLTRYPFWICNSLSNKFSKFPGTLVFLHGRFTR